MRGLSQFGGPHERSLLREHWSIGSTPSNPDAILADASAVVWTPIPTLGTVADALRALQAWSLDGPARRFDAEDWWYRLEFSAGPSIYGERVLLGFDGLATLAQVWLNGALLLHSDNMFVAHGCDVGSLLQAGGNTLVLRFASLDTALTARRKRPRWRVPMLENQQLRWHRTTVLGRTPGWSPPAAAVGPWKDIWLERRRHLDLNDLVLRPGVQGTDGVLHCSLQLELPGAVTRPLTLQLRRKGQNFSQALARGADGRWSVDLRVPQVDLWWPHTHGEPALYQAVLAVGAESDACEVALGSIGFRTLGLQTGGGDFTLSVNGVPVFCRGACWTPLDPVSLRATPQAYGQALAQVQKAGMNMLRIAGTMVYEDEAFFDACDAAGVLVWQDFMFANMDFPADDPDFLQSVETEVRQQLGRVAHRASLAMLCGNSEVAQQAAMWGAPRELWSSPLFEEHMAAWCAELAPATPYWPSSAYGGAFAHQGNVGTTSYYGVGAYQRPLEDARRSELKFATECLAFANIPEDSALERMPTGLAVRAHHPAWKARSPRDLGAGWDFDDVRDHYLERIFGLDANKLRYSDHERYLKLGRMATGEAMAAAFAEWRRPASSCRGAMVLFMRDLWAGAGWGLVDDAGRPKACLYYLQRVLQPTSVSLSDEGGNGLFVHVHNEGGQARSLELEIAAWRGADVQVAKSQKSIALPAHGAQNLAAQELFEHFTDFTYAYRFGPRPCDVVVATLKDEVGQTRAQAFYFPEGMPLHQSDPGLATECQWLDASTVQVTISTQGLALGVHCDVVGFIPDDAYFHMAPKSSVQLTLRATQPRAFFGALHALNATQAITLSLQA